MTALKMPRRLSPRPSCSFCGHPATGEWNGYQQKQIFCCGRCAVDNLPALAADSAIIHAEADAYRVFDQMALRFWRSLALKMLAEREGESQ